jgi:hypothetical protein
MESKDKDHSNGKWYTIKDLNVVTWNIGGITHKVDVLDKELKSRNIDSSYLKQKRRIKDQKNWRIT